MRLHDVPDDELMRRVQAQDAAAFEELYRRYARPLQSFFYRMAWDAGLSEDWMQEVFVKLWRSAAQYQGTGKFSTYLFQIARNHWLNAQDKVARRPREVSLEKKKTPASARPGSRRRAAIPAPTRS